MHSMLIEVTHEIARKQEHFEIPIIEMTTRLRDLLLVGLDGEPKISELQNDLMSIICFSRDHSSYAATRGRMITFISRN
jgi:hypothetical protein